jgi:glycosyltransferase involved in cell wall biosynthesis
VLLERKSENIKTCSPTPIRVVHYMGTNFGMTGVETFILQLCAAQKRSGLAPSIALDLSDREEVRAIAEAHEIEVYNMPPLKGGKLTKLWSRLRCTKLLWQLFRHSQVIHIHAVGISCFEGILASALSRNTALVVTHHATLSWFTSYRNLISDVTFWMEKHIACRVVMPYGAAVAELVEHGIPAVRAICIPFCVDELLFFGLAREPTREELILVMSARMFRGKGHMELLGALARLSPRYPKLRAVFVGEGPTRHDIEAEIDRLALRHVVECKGRVDHRDVPAIMRSAHVVVLPSYMEGRDVPPLLN